MNVSIEELTEMFVFFGFSRAKATEMALKLSYEKEEGEADNDEDLKESRRPPEFRQMK